MTLPRLNIGNLSIELPIIQGGMGVAVSRAGPARAVSAAGGLGVIASVGLNPVRSKGHRQAESARQGLLEEILSVKERGLPVGVNIMVALTDYKDLVEACVEGGADVILSGAGLPRQLPGYVEGSDIKLVPIVSSGRAAELLCKTWLKKYNRAPDAIVVEGPMAGGHLGFKHQDLLDGTAPTLENLAREVLVVAEKFEQQLGRPLPVIVAGGIFTGQDIAAYLNMGAAGVQMGTRFVGTHECDASDAYKQSYVNAKEEDVALVLSPVGLPARVVKNAFIESSLEGVKHKFSCPYKCLITCDARKANYCIADALINSAEGDMANGFAMCGQNAYRVNKIVSVKELMDELVSDALPRIAAPAESEATPLSRCECEDGGEVFCAHKCASA